jgi:hypothetical protein
MHTKRIIKVLRRAGFWSRTCRKSPHAATPHLPGHLHALLGWRLTGLGLNPKAIERHSPLALDQLRSKCALCEHKRRCLDGMMDYRSPPGWKSYCPNASAIRALLIAPDASSVRIAVGDRCQGA